MTELLGHSRIAARSIAKTDPDPGRSARDDDRLPPLRVAYEHALLDDLLSAPDVLTVIGFGPGAPGHHANPRYLRVALDSVASAAPFEVWRTQAPVLDECAGEVRAARTADYVFGAIEVDEAQHAGIAAATAHAYRTLCAFVKNSATPHVLRVWNFLDAINLGNGDSERYREFCTGRAAGMADAFAAGFPAATAIGVRDGKRIIQVYWLAARRPGSALENPRQVSAWHYPRKYGPTAPSFARAVCAPTHTSQIYISGTAAVVGHASQHAGDLDAQVDEIVANLSSLLGSADATLRMHFGPDSLLKAYVRHADDLARVDARLRARLPAEVALLVLRGDICRSELLVEVEGTQNA